MSYLTALSACSSHSNQAARDYNSLDDLVLRRGLPGEPVTLDPQRADDDYSFQVLRDIYEGLTAENPSGAVIPGIAKSWSVDASGTVYTFQLQDEAKWSDGTPIVAAEFVEGLRRAVDPKTAAASAALLSIIKGAADITVGHKSVSELGVVSQNEHSLQITLEHPAPFILQILSQPIAAPVQLPERSSGPKIRNDERVTDGPYVLVAHVPNSFIQLERNPYYHSAAGIPAIKTIRYEIVESAATELKEFLAGQLDLTFTVPTPDLLRIAKKFPALLQTAPFLGTFYLALNMQHPPLQNAKRLRQALSMSVDRIAIARYLMMGVTPAYGFVAKGISDYAGKDYDWSKWDEARRLDSARALYRAAGYTSDKPLHLRMYFNQDDGIRQVMTAVAGNWKQNLGVESELISEEFRVFLSGRRNRAKWDVARLGWNADYDDASSFLEVFGSTSGENDPGYFNTEFDNLILKARSERDPSLRISWLSRAEDVFLADYPIIPIYFYKARRLVSSRLGGAQITPLNHTYSRYLYWKATP